MQRLTAKFEVAPPGRKILLAAIGLSLAVHAGVALVGQGYNPVRDGASVERPVLVAVTLAAPAAAVLPSDVSPQPADALPASPMRPRTARVKRTLPPLTKTEVAEVAVTEIPSETRVAASPVPELPLTSVLPEAKPTLNSDPVAQAEPPLTRADFNPDALAARVDISYRATSNLVDGHGSYVFEREGSRYEIRGELGAEGIFAEAFIGKISQHVEGTVSRDGLRPTLISNTTGSAPPELASVDWQAGRLSFERAGKTRSEAMEGVAQDVISLLFSFAGGVPTAQGARFNIVTPRGQNAYGFEVLGTEKLNLRIGMVETVHVRLSAGNNRGVYEAWLAPEYKHLPVRLKFPAAQGRVVFDMVATRVKVG